MPVPLPTPKDGDTLLDVHHCHLSMWRKALGETYMADHEVAALDVALDLLNAARLAAKPQRTS